MTIDRNVKIYGTSEAPEEARSVHLGSLSFLCSTESVRRICWRNTELVRAVTWPIRDENWGTYAPEILQEAHEETDGIFKGSLTFSVADGGLECSLSIHATSAGELQLSLKMTPKNGAFSTNRAGFTILHPIRGIAGAPLTVTHSDGSEERTEFPRLISPGQPVFDIQNLTYSLGGKTAMIAFSEEVFEMEDQRNWSDASFKTYCVPLVHPFTYTIDGSVTQSIHISLSGASEATGGEESGTELTVRQLEESAPGIGLVVEPGWADTSENLLPGALGHIRARVSSADQDDYLAQLSELAKGRELDLELVLSKDDTSSVALERFRQKALSAGLAPRRIVTLRDGYLASHQPSGPWPDGPVPSEVVSASRAVFPDALIGGGMLTNFTEFNRCRPAPELCDFVTHANTAIVHASDDLSVCETLETLPQIFESAQAIGEGKPYRLGLVSIGMRSNPYGAAVAENPEQVRRTMAREDPRQRGLFAAAWAVGVLTATEGKKVEALCLAAPSGPFGIVYTPQPYSQAFYDEAPDACVYPLHHVVKTASAMAGNRRLSISGLPEGVFAYGVELATGPRLMVANVSPGKATVRLKQPGQVTILDSSTFIAATTRADWLDIAPRQDAMQFELEGFAVAFVE
ncbi:hypothetical protein [Nisaea sp.]|uniref:hypothetical protein n=1 Tax=Nisaea sp. TaxID=2024842 RepID=UPI0032992D08